MGSFGERLQRERELRGITLEEIAEATKIGTRSLRALEEQDFDQLPGGIFNKGFVRAYARYLGLDDEQAVADYHTALSEAIAAGKVTRGGESTANAANAERNSLNSDIESRERFRMLLAPALVVLVLAALLYGGWRYVAKHGMPKLRQVKAAGQVQPHRVAAAANPSYSTSVAPTASTSVAPAEMNVVPAATAPEDFVVRVRAKQDCWVSIEVDGKEVMSGTLAGASEKSVHAQHNLVVKAGNATAIELFHNEKPVAVLGAAGQVKTMEFTAAGLKQ